MRAGSNGSSKSALVEASLSLSTSLSHSLSPSLSRSLSLSLSLFLPISVPPSLTLSPYVSHSLCLPLSSYLSLSLSLCLTPPLESLPTPPSQTPCESCRGDQWPARYSRIIVSNSAQLHQISCLQSPALLPSSNPGCAHAGESGFPPIASHTEGNTEHDTNQYRHT